MTLFTGIIVYLLVWWVTLFVVLPWGVRQEEPEEGHQRGAPANPRIWRKFLINTGLAFLVWLVIFGLVEADLISFRAMVRDWER